MATAGPSHAEDLFNCSICLDEFKDPRYLNCHHTYCLDCLDAVARRVPKSDIVLCPVCQQATALPQSGVNGLRKNIMIEQMKQLMDTTAKKAKKANKAHAVGRMCDACKNNKKSIATFHCNSCWAFFCDKCVENHNQSMMFRDHTVNAVPTNVEYCMVHLGQAVGYVCQCEPDILLCALCIMDHDKEHEVQTISQARHTLLQDTLVAVNDTKLYLRSHLDDISTMTYSYEAVLVKVERSIKQQAKCLIDEVRRKEAEMIEEADRRVKEALAKYQADRITRQLQYTENMEKSINQVIQDSNCSCYLKDFKRHREFMEFRGNGRPKAIPETGIIFVPPDNIPPIHLGVLQGTRKAATRNNDGSHRKNKRHNGPVVIAS